MAPGKKTYDTGWETPDEYEWRKHWRKDGWMLPGYTFQQDWTPEEMLALGPGAQDTQSMALIVAGVVVLYLVMS